ncbi:hypothetical protein WR25_04440 isoform C [Diploscapter pachys]|uniref:Uncharacterized protein n=1 Tax=Diploscapter pachys TaxID=2018661 RepID=A0A2A2LG78_9BILA|nr:hypothetical protein WR25_04440 isoform A [Diploscapter pachys]PAV85171.1 hypothetical protein WR25_04440 isoform C [Diploscapter pachys]
MKGQNKTDLWTFTNYNDFYAQLAQIGKSSFIASDSQYQDLLGALFYAQQQTENMAFAQTWLFADSLPTDNFPENTLMSSGSIENLLIQTTLNWRTKMTVFLCQDDSKPISLKGDAHYNILYRIIRATHGDIFLVNGNELKPALQNVLSTYQNVEDIAAYYDFQPVNSISFEVHQDTVSQTMYLMMWIKPDSNAVSAPNVNATNANLQKLSSGKYFAFYKLTPSEGQINVSITTSADVSFNVRCFVQSRRTVILNYNASPKIDFGNGFAWAGIPMWTAIRPLNIDSAAYVSRRVRAPDGYPITEEVYSEFKPLEASIAPYLMNVWNDSCPPGALTTEVNIYRNDYSYIRRILAGYCSSAVTHNADSTDAQESNGRIPNIYGPSFAKSAISQKDAATTCPNTNVDATLFIFENSLALKETSSKIFQLLNDSLPSWEQSGYTPKHNFDIQTFLTKLQPTTVNLNYKLTKASRVLDAIYLATQLILVPPMMINVILNQDSAILPLSYNFSLVDKNIQINIFSFSHSGQYSAFPKDERLTSLVRQSGGRFMPLQLDDHVVTTNFIKSVFMEKQLVMDERVSDCSSGKNFSFLIDTESQYATLKAVGSSATLKVFDAKSVPIQLNGANGVVNLVSSSGIQIFEIDLSKANLAKGQWTASISTDNGECGLQVRIVGPYTVVPGFSSTNSNDFPMMQLFGARGKKNGAASIMFRLFTQSSGNKTMALNNVKYLGTSVQDQFNESNDNKNWQTMKINARDATSCTYQYATDVFNVRIIIIFQKKKMCFSCP